MPEVQPRQPFHKKALLAVLAAHPERAAHVLEKLIGALPDSLDYADISSTELSEEILDLLNQERKFTVGMLEFARGGAELKPRPEPSAARPGPEHFLSEDHNGGDPICTCGWRPTFLSNQIPTLESGRSQVREHIAHEKEKALNLPKSHPDHPDHEHEDCCK